MRKLTLIALSAILVLFLAPVNLMAQDQCFERIAEIEIPEVDLNTGGIGNVISNVDVDGDGMTELYIVNDMWDNVLDGAHEEIPRIYKLEWNGSAWNQVWQAVAPVTYQNTWPVLVLTDLDGDGKQELTWAPANNFTEEANPYRILVYEHEGGSSDNFGVADGDAFKPNSMWAFPAEDNVNVRPMHGAAADIDDDGKQEFLFADRKGGNGGYYFGICSVSDVPDDGDGSETWTMETSGLDHPLPDGINNKWTVAVLGSNAYFFSETEISKVSWDGSAYTYAALAPLEGGFPNQSAEVVDIDGDGTEEIIIAVYDDAGVGDDAKKAILLLQENGANDLTRTTLVNINMYFDSRGAWGSTSGDVDGDGNLDFIFGSRGGTDVNVAQIFRLAYRGGDITDPNNYVFSTIDKNYDSDAGAGAGVWSIVSLANVDSDEALEVIYGSSVPYGGDLFNPDATKPMVVLDYTCEPGSDPVLSIAQTGTVVDGYKLSQNYPNPFNPTTTIAFEVPSDELITLTVYNMLGHEVATLVNENLSQGAYEVTWSGKDKIGNIVPAGAYIYQLKAGNTIKVRKMTYIK